MDASMAAHEIDPKHVDDLQCTRVRVMLLSCTLFSSECSVDSIQWICSFLQTNLPPLWKKPSHHMSHSVATNHTKFASSCGRAVAAAALESSRPFYAVHSKDRRNFLRFSSEHPNVPTSFRVSEMQLGMLDANPLLHSAWQCLAWRWWFTCDLFGPWALLGDVLLVKTSQLGAIANQTTPYCCNLRSEGLMFSELPRHQRKTPLQKLHHGSWMSSSTYVLALQC